MRLPCGPISRFEPYRRKSRNVIRRASFGEQTRKAIHRARDRDIQAIARKKKREIARHVLAAGSCDKKKTIGACWPWNLSTVPTTHATWKSRA